MPQSDNIDAVIIATPNHWHTKIEINVVKSKKHVNFEKCMTRTIVITFAVAQVVKNSDVVFQLGHQNRHAKS